MKIENVNDSAIYPPILEKEGYTDISLIKREREVYKAKKSDIGFQAIKRIKKEHIKSLGVRETEILTTLDDPRLPTVTAVFYDEDALYIAMRYISGEDLEKRIVTRRRAMPEADALKYFVELCEVFGYLHRKGVIHQDCKPSNIMLNEEGKIYLIDFGISKISTHKDVPAYTKYYAAPEQITGEETDERSDIYSLGATMYTLLTLRRLDGKKSDVKIARGELAVNKNISANLKKIIIKCLAQDPLKRYQTMEDLKSDLEKKSIVTTIKLLVSGALMLLSTVAIILGYFTWQDEVTSRLLNRGAQMQEIGNYQRAQTLIEEYIRRRSTAPNGYAARRELLVDRGLSIESIQYFNYEEWYARFSNYARYFNVYVYNAAWERAFRGAMEMYYQAGEWTRVLELLNNPRVSIGYREELILARSNIHLENWESALYFFERLRLRPLEEHDGTPREHIDALLDASHILARETDLPDAFEHRYNFLTEALMYSYDIGDVTLIEEINRLLYSYYTTRAEMYYSYEDFETYLEVARTALDRFPDSFELRYYRAIAMLLYSFDNPDVRQYFEEYVREALDTNEARRVETLRGYFIVFESGLEQIEGDY